MKYIIGLILLSSLVFAGVGPNSNIVQYSTSGVATNVSIANPLPVAATFSGTIGTVGQGTPGPMASPWPMEPTDGTNHASFTAGNSQNVTVNNASVAVTAASLPLPAGAATSALQTTGNTSVNSIDTKTPALVSGRVPVDGSGVTQPVSGTFYQATQPVSGTFYQATQPVSAASLPLPSGAATSALQAKNAINTAASGSAAAATVSTVATLTAPANAVGFVLMNLDVSTTNMRWAVGRTATTTLGQQLQPGRDTGFVPIGANISIIAESGTCTYDVQWVSQ